MFGLVPCDRMKRLVNKFWLLLFFILFVFALNILGQKVSFCFKNEQTTGRIRVVDRYQKNVIFTTRHSQIIVAPIHNARRERNDDMITTCYAVDNPTDVVVITGTDLMFLLIIFIYSGMFGFYLYDKWKIKK